MALPVPPYRLNFSFSLCVSIAFANFLQAVKCLAIHGRAVLVGIGGNQTLEGVDIYRDILGNTEALPAEASHKYF